MAENTGIIALTEEEADLISTALDFWQGYTSNPEHCDSLFERFSILADEINKADQ